MTLIKFNTFEKIKNAVINEGVDPAELSPLFESEQINEGIFSAIKNFFSKLLGGKIDKIDKIIEKYKDNEADYWKKWGEANFSYNKADTILKELSDPTQKAKYMEMKERADKLLTQIDKSRDGVNDALQRQASLLIKGSDRLTDYYLMMKAKADEEVANDSYKGLKKIADDDTVDTLYKKLEVDAERARKKEEEFKKKYGGQTTGSGVKFENNMSKLGIDDPNEMIYKDLTDEVKEELDDIAADEKKAKSLNSYLESKIKRIKDRLSDEQKKGSNSDLENTAKQIIKTLEKKIDYLQKSQFSKSGIKDKVVKAKDVVTPVTNQEIGKDNINATVDASVKKVEKGEDDVNAKNVVQDITKENNKFFDDSRSIIEDSTGPMSDEAYQHLKNDLVSLFGKITFAYKEQNKETKLRTLQMSIVNFAAKVYEYKKGKEKLTSDLSDAEIGELFDTYSKQ